MLHVDGRFSDPLKQNRGVRQGDPLSPLLFNCVINWALASLDPEMGKVVGRGPSHLAFADDVSSLRSRWLASSTCAANLSDR